MSTNSWFQFEDGGSYAGEVDPSGSVHGFGVAKGRGGRGEFAGIWNFGFEQSGSFIGSFGQKRYEGQWSEGKRNGLGTERIGDWIYRGEFMNGVKGRYGVKESCRSCAKYEGTWANGLHDGHGVETYADGGTYQGQWLNGLRHGYGFRQSSTYEQTQTTHQKLLKSRSDEPSNPGSGKIIQLNTILLRRDFEKEGEGGFVLTEDVSTGHRKFQHFLDKLGRSGFRRTAGKNLSQTGRRMSVDAAKSLEEGERQEQRSHTGSLKEKSDYRKLETENITKLGEDDRGLHDPGKVLDGGITERYSGQWNQDKRCGYGVCQRSDGLSYEGEWRDNKKCGFGRTTLPDRSRIDGKYKDNTLISPVRTAGKGPKLLSSTTQDKIENAVREAKQAADNAKHEAELALIRIATAKAKADESVSAVKEATRNEERARIRASETTEREPRSGINVKMHRIDEDAFWLEYDVAAIDQISASLKESIALSSKRLRLPFNLRLTQPKQNFAGESSQKTSTTKSLSFPWRKKQSLETRQDGKFGQSAAATSGHHFDFHNLQQPLFTLNEETNEEVREIAGVEAHFRLDPVTVGGLSEVKGERRSGDAIKRELIGAEEPKDAMHPRRKSLPSIMKEKVFEPTGVPAPAPGSTGISASTVHVVKRSDSTKPTTAPPAPPRKSKTETYLIDKGVRKRVKYLYEEVETVQRSPTLRKNPSLRTPIAGTSAMGKLIMSTMLTGFALSQKTPLRDWTDESTDFKKMYAFESPKLGRRNKNTGSTSDVSMIKPTEVMSREAVYVMSQRKREEIIQRRVEEEKRKGTEIVISISAFQDWRYVLLVLVCTLPLVFLLYHVTRNR